MSGTPSRGEAAAWRQLRRLRGEGFSFRREQTIGAYRADFVCLRRRLIIEIDGGVHDLPGRKDKDAERDVWLAAEGFVVLRFPDREILSEANWLDRVRTTLQARREYPFRAKPNKASLPLEGGEVGEGVKLQTRRSPNCAFSQAHNDDLGFTPPPAPSPSRGGE